MGYNLLLFPNYLTLLEKHYQTKTYLQWTYVDRQALTIGRGQVANVKKIPGQNQKHV